MPAPQNTATSFDLNSSVSRAIIGDKRWLSVALLFENDNSSVIEFGFIIIYWQIYTVFRHSTAIIISDAELSLFTYDDNYSWLEVIPNPHEFMLSVLNTCLG